MVFKLALDAADRIQLIVERVALLHHALRRGGIVPQFGVFGSLIQLREARVGLIEVKDASSAVQPTA
jgi:hypothetical protein